MMIPMAPKLFLKGMVRMLKKNPEKFESNMQKNMPEVDRAVLEIPGMKEAFNHSEKVLNTLTQ